MKRLYKKFLSYLLCTVLLMGTVSAAAAPAPLPPAAEPEDYPDHFAGTPGPDNLDYLMYPSLQAKAPAAEKFNDIKNIVVFVNFAGESEFVTEKRMNTVEQLYNVQNNSLKGYLDHITYGAINVDSYFYPQNQTGTGVISYVDPKPIGYYKTKSTDNLQGYSTSTERYTRERELTSGAFNYVKAQVEAQFTADQLDNNGDGRIDSIAFIVNGFSGTGGGIAWNDLLWSHKISASGLYFHNKQILNYNLILAEIPIPGSLSQNTGIMADDPSKARHSVIIHEFLHTLGLPDLYHYSSSGSPVGEWDIMANTTYQPQNMLQYIQRDYMGWGKPVHEANLSGSYTLKTAKYENMDVDGGYDGSPETALILRSPASNKEFFVVEYRLKSGFDSQLPASGLIIYRMNLSISNGNASGPPEFAYVFRPSETSTAPAYNTYYANFSKQSGRTSIGKALGAETTGFDNGTLYFSDGKNSGIIIDQIGNAGEDTINLRITLPSGALEGSGTAASPYLISEAAQFDYLRQYPNKYFRLKNNIAFPSGFAFKPIENFTGTLDGAGYTLSNLLIGTTDNIPVGFFSTLGKGSKVLNLTFDGVSASGTGNTGVLAGSLFGTAENITIQGGTVNGLTVGGLCGTADSTAVISGCITSAKVSGTTAGGLAGRTESAQWSNCFSSGAITGGTGGSVSALFGKQIVTTSYRPAQKLFWDINASGQTSAAQTEIVSGASTGLEGMTGIRLPKAVIVNTGESVKLTVDTIPAGATITGTWSIKNSQIATIENGGITGIAPGNTILTYTIPITAQRNAVLSVPVTVTYQIGQPEIIHGELTAGSQLTFRIPGGAGQELYTYYLLFNGRVYYKASSTISNSFSYQPQEKGNYTLMCYIKTNQGEIMSRTLSFTVA